jgi:hypothetical protein
MANDFKQKEPSKTERMLYELVMAHNQMEKGLWSTSTVAMALAMLTKQDPKEIAELMVNGDAKLKEYSQKINDEIKKLEEAKHKDHNHSEHEGHEHDISTESIT